MLGALKRYLKRNTTKKVQLNDAYALERLIQELNRDPTLKATLYTVEGTKIVLETTQGRERNYKQNWELNT